jgi:hypothetical protein
MYINLNHNKLYLADIPNGSTQNIEVKVGRKTYMVDINKNSASAYVCVYDKLSRKRNAYSKYSDNLHAVHTRVDATLDREFIERIEEIEKAVALIEHFGYPRNVFNKI